MRRKELRTQVWGEVRFQKLMATALGRRQPKALVGCQEAAGRRLLTTYTALAVRGEHLLQSLLAGQRPKQWLHYPKNDAIDQVNGYQWFYHSHSPEDRAGAIEHGHFHLFARRQLWARRLQSKAEKGFADKTGNPSEHVNTRHLLTIGLDAKGVPISLLTVNSWVTGDLMLSAANTEWLLAQMHLDTGHPEIDAVLESVITLCADEIRQMLTARDVALSAKPPRDVLDDRGLEVLSETTIELDRKLAAI